ncbi:MAG: hypothetical protein JSV30_04585 [Candidatus Omnitrophota bacterium]|nr:MAG: hypothetical protein JSV30_04585 [Candidatus Omnitrophota bacterium]
MKKVLIRIAVVLAALFVLSLAKDMIIKGVVSTGVRVLTGLRLNIRSMRVGVFKSLAAIEGLRIYNPSNFPDPLMMDMPQIYVDYDFGSIFSRKMHFEELKLDLKEFVVVKNRQGKLNLDSLKVVQAQKKLKEKAKEPSKIQIDILELKIGKVLYKDYSKGGEPSVKEFDVNIHEKYENIDNPYALVSLIVVKSLMKTNIARLADFDLEGLKGMASDVLGRAQRLISDIETKATKKAQELIKETPEVLDKATEGLKSIFKELQTEGINK